MERVYSKKNLIVSRVISMVIGVLVGVLLLVLAALLKPSTVATIIYWGLVVYGILIIIGNVLGLIAGIANVRTPEGMVNVILSILGIAMGAVLIFNQSVVLVWIVAAYMIVFPVVRILIAKKGTRGEAFKRELLRMILGVLLLVFLPGLTNAAFNVVHWVLKIAGWVTIALSVLLGVIGIVRVLTAKASDGVVGTRVYVDTDGNGKVDTVLMDTTGDGKLDTVVRVDENK